MRDPKRVARILRIRQRQEEIARAAWQMAEMEARKASEQSLLAGDRVRASLVEVRNVQRARTPHEVLQAHWALDGLQQELRTKQANARFQENLAKSKKEPWIERRRTVLAMEKWKQRADQDHRQWRIQREEKAQEGTLETNLTRKSQSESTQ